MTVSMLWMEWTGTHGFGEVYEWTRTNQEALFEQIWGVPKIERTSRVSAATTILDMLRSCNNPESVERDHRAYVNMARIGVGKNHVGVGWLRWWYERNLIVYANVMRLVESADDRILLIIGAAHIHLVSQFMRESGLVEVELGYEYLLR